MRQENEIVGGGAGLFLTSILFWIPQIVNSSGLSGSHAETGHLVMIPYILSAVVM